MSHPHLHKETAIPLPPPVSRILARFDAIGGEAFCVGGCVRDALRGTVPADWDICTSALPRETLSLFSDCRCLTVGLRHGTVTVFMDGIPYEITTYRVDGTYENHRRPETVTFTPSLYEDCARRDLTVNAMAYHPQRGLFDPFGGREDLKNGIIRCVGDPDTRLEEDALRIMRAIRFAAALDFKIDGATENALRRKAPLLSFIARERIAAELSRLLMGPGAARLLSAFASVLAVVLPPCASLADEGLSAPLERAFSRLSDGEGMGELRMAAMLYLCRVTREEATGCLRRLTLSNAVVEDVETLLAEADVPLPQSTVDMRKCLTVSHREALHRRIRLYEALHPEESEACTRATALLRASETDPCPTRISDLAVNGHDLMSMGITGPAVGCLLRTLLTEVIEERLPNDAQALREAAARHREA